MLLPRLGLGAGFPSLLSSLLLCDLTTTTWLRASQAASPGLPFLVVSLRGPEHRSCGFSVSVQLMWPRARPRPRRLGSAHASS